MLAGNCKPAHHLFVVLLILGCFVGADAQDEGCYTSGSVAGIVIATIVVTIVMGGLAAAFVWYIWRQRKGPFEDSKSQEKPIMCPPMSPDKQLIAKENNDYAFDNPYFKDDEVDHKNPDTAEKGESGFHLDNGDITTPVQQNAKQSNGTNGQAKKNRPFSSLPFHAVFHPSSGKKQKTTMDDTYISKHLERITVPLRGHDFTGLGFNICGNMRDGIFVKDVLHRGPASESGKIKAGDKIIGVTVSFGAMVYEDALTILSYASPYDVRLEIEKCPTTSSAGTPPHLPSSSPKKLGASTSFRSGGQRRLFHPLYRSQSIDDLTQIGKDVFLSGNSPSTQKDSFATPKRSQSVETNSAAMKTRLKANDESANKSSSSNKGSRKSSTSSCDSTGKIIVPTTLPENVPTTAPVKEVETPCTKKEVKSSRFRVEQINVKSEAHTTQSKNAPPVKPIRDISEDKQIADTNGTEDVTNAKETDPPPKPVEETTGTDAQSNGITDKTAAETETDAKQPTVPPRKISTPKRKAPAPPPAAPAKTETSAVVHRADEQTPEQTGNGEAEVEKEVSPSEAPPPPMSELPDFATMDLESSDNSSVVSASHHDTKEEPSSPGKRKASSLGDLTKLEHGNDKKASVSSAILERAVSLDLQQSIPGENLVKQKKVLRAPAFDNDYDEENDLHDTEGACLKRWDNGLDKVLGLTNGHLKHDDEESNKDETEPSVDQQDSGVTLSSVIETEAVTKKLITVDIDLDSSGSETTLQEALDSEKHLTSTPMRKVIEVKNFIKEDDSIDDIPYLASNKQQEEINDDELSAKHSNKTNNNSIFSPVTISIPVIKPDLTHFEKLPSPPPASTHPALDPSWRAAKAAASEDSSKYGLERISVQSLYKPIFSSKEVPVSEETKSEDVTAEKLVNGNDSDSSEHYSTAQETSMESNSVSTVSVTLSPMSSNTTNVTIKTPNNVAGFAKTLIIPGPNEVENLLSLAAEPNTPPPQLEPPPKPVENE